jgi:hypothetical protein
VIVGHEEVAIVIILHVDIIMDSSKIVAQVQIAGRANTAHYNFLTHKKAKIMACVRSKHAGTCFYILA